MEQLKTIEASLLQAYEMNCVVQLTLTNGYRPSGLIAAVNGTSLLLNQKAGVVNQIKISEVTEITFLKESWWQR
ncbi:hypothetical protein [Lactiplantibacillus mudanjiangensis]|uniref:Uncharacterized protein n=1 Tax=Lactiplantibacillus mudanjiangensis TaxID=1296538 RepID=A0A660E0N5_9LACO|nr:hypothetical protein [Lactiplantibacillus mudanjiangensis]VDG21157.1 hypothetical protein [Lactobacillus sp. CBA3605] [Lactiplantibacillus mudanjiangensis]VDG22906.1 hypothetical protein [Lactobacillus sp. CBA3605] [Lactiplantibacillus mudanjiangensis]VDG29234.1 hypothetical protein [Lactobacillus sp. CBA3605] [Lactiplantibacillus mudanjiangensis]VDG31760.1 hypothetical protein [Lactobacillus sp. CBA3605] [Lactiplantibacillus mudanjiangensis]